MCQASISERYVRNVSLSSMLPMYERRKSTMSTTSSIAGTISSLRHVFASGHFDLRAFQTQHSSFDVGNPSCETVLNCGRRGLFRMLWTGSVLKVRTSHVLQAVRDGFDSTWRGLTEPSWFQGNVEDRILRAEQAIHM